MKFAIIQDRPSQSGVLKMLLNSGGHQVAIFANGAACLEALKDQTFEFFIIDVSCPEVGGEQLLQYIRGHCGWDPAVICVSTRDDEETIVHMLSQGADCFMAMPIRFMEFMARVDALCRSLCLSSPSPVCVGDIKLDQKTRRIVLGEAEVRLTQREFDLAALLLSNIGRVFSRQELLQDIWSHRTLLDTRTVDIHICKLRRKLGLDGGVGLVLTSVYGQGYRLDSIRGA